MERVGRRSWAIALGVVLVLGMSDAVADTVGVAGKLVGIRRVTPASDSATKLRGAVYVDEGGGVITEYVWSGAWCPGKNLTEAEIQILAGFVGDGRVRITPIYRFGQASKLCLVDFVIAHKKVADQIAP